MIKSAVITPERFIDDPNAEEIEMFLQNEFPQTQNNNVESILTSVVEEMIGSRQVRLAGRPTPESEVAMRDVVRKCINQNHPIPVLVAAGPKKTVANESIDIAELSALKMLACLNKRVKKHYSLGITVRFRLEDATGYYLEEGVADLHETIERYVQDLTTLIKVLGYDFIEPIREISLVSEKELRETADKTLPLLMSYLQDSEHVDEDHWETLASWKQLSQTGWQGMISRKMRQYYHKRYTTLFPEYDENERLMITAKYLANTLARHQLKATGVVDNWPGFFQINFAPPVPGTPEALVSTRLYYRTVPMKHTKRHMPFWRAKGILKLNGKTRMTLVNWNEDIELTEFYVTFTNGTDSVEVRADYILE